MIVVLCDKWQDACDAFDIFCAFCERYEPFMIKESDEFSLRAISDDDLVYIFTPYWMRPIFEGQTPDIMEADEFFEGLYSHYDADIFEDFHYGWVQW